MTHTCPRCLGLIPRNDRPGQYPGATSRTDNATEVCSDCGTEEAFEQFSSADHACTPQSAWPIESSRKVNA